jgi:hypothetical protein
MNTNDREPFYVGYLPQAPAGLRPWLKFTILALLALSCVAALLVAMSFQRLPLSVFEYGQVREYVGVIRTKPYPSLIVVNGAQIEHYLLVGEGKHAAVVTPFSGKKVKLSGTLIKRDDMKMVEISEESIVSLEPTTNDDLPVEMLGQFTLVGEIVDSKCFLGVMNPGQFKSHRDCAVRCISGGVPPLLLARAANGQEVALQLVSAGGAPLSKEVLDYVAEPIQITGSVTRSGEWLTMHADPATYQRR